MARFVKQENKYPLSSDSEWYVVEGKLNQTDIERINTYPKKIILILENTKGLDTDIIDQITSKNVCFSIMGGLDYLNKNKFKDYDYVDRTIITPEALSKIINYFEKIESQIRYSWTDTQKCMYIYKTLVENLHYKYKNEKDWENGKDVVRSLYGVLYGKLVCSGFALVFKEMLDRIGIENYYQNRRSHHSWNIVKLDGKYRGLEITWDCYNKTKDNHCAFNCFGIDSNFYQNKHHDLSNEPEEKHYSLEPFSIDEIRKNYRIITENSNIKLKKMDELIDNEGNKIYYTKLKEENNIKTYMVYLEGRVVPIYSDQEPEECLTRNNIINAVVNNQNYIYPLRNNLKTTFKTYKRNDDSRFAIIKNQVLKNNMNEHYYFDVIKTDEGIQLRRGVIISEIDLSLNYGEKYENIIANSLLSKERLKRKMLYYHGYVGYVSQRGSMLYDRDFEVDELNISKRF